MRWATLCLGMVLCVFAPDTTWVGATLLVAVAGMVWRMSACRGLLWLCLGTVYVFWRLQDAVSTQIAVDAPNNSQVAVVTVLDLSSRDNKALRPSQQFLARVELPNSNRKHRVLAQDHENREWALGSVWRCPLRLRANIGAVNPSGFNSETWALSNRIDGFAVLGQACQALGQEDSVAIGVNRIRARVQQRLAQLPSDELQGKALVAALTIGLQDGLDDGTWLSFRRLGVVHLVSISGVHVTMLAALCAWLIGRLMRLLPFAVKTPMLWQVWGGVLVAFAYALLAGFQVPTQRTVWMLLVFALALTMRRRVSIWQVWWLALAVVLLIEPTALLSIGLWLSFALVGVMVWANQVTRLPRNQHWKMWLKAQWAAWLLTLIWVGAYFHSVPVWSSVANFVAIPWFSWVLTPLALLACVLPWDAPLEWVVTLAQWTVEIANNLSVGAWQWVVAQSPWWATLLATIAVWVMVLPHALGLRLWAAVVVFAYVCYRPPALQDGQLRMEVVDVGQGLSVLLQTRHHGLLFDTGRGNAGSFVLPALQRRGLTQLDALVLSHHDSDHDGAAASLRSQFSFQTLWAGEPQAYPNWQAQSCRDHSWLWDGVWFEWLTLPESEVAASNNARSCVLRVVTVQQAVLIPADVGKPEEAALLLRYGKNVRSNVLVLGHHGSSSSNSSAWLNAVAPDVAIASAGWRNSYGHPTIEVQHRLQAHEIALYRTDTQGSAAWLFDGNQRQRELTGRLYWWQRKPFEASQ